MLKHCLLEPIPEITEAARLLDAAVDAHLAGSTADADGLIRKADIVAITEWTEWLWGQLHIDKTFAMGTRVVPKAERVPKRAPTAATITALHSRDGFHCRFCGIPVIRPKVRDYLRQHYPSAARWGSRNAEQHAALQAMQAHYDHVIPHSRGGDNSVDNLVVACAPCNCARMEAMVEEVGLEDPRRRPPIRSLWDGLERILQARVIT